MTSKIEILGVQINAITNKEALDMIKVFLSSEKQHQIVTLNSEMIVQSQKDSELKKIIGEAAMVTADGAGILRIASFEKRRVGSYIKNLFILAYLTIASVIQPRKIKDVIAEKISGIDLIEKIFEDEFLRHKKIYLIGGRGDTAERAKRAIEKKYKSTNIVGAEEGIADWKNSKENQELLGRINSKNPEIIFVAFGCPKQEKWISKNLANMPSVKIAIGVGGSLDFISGNISRAPKFLQNHGLEWLWRLMREPKRIGRIWNATLEASRLILKAKNDKM